MLLDIEVRRRNKLNLPENLVIKNLCLSPKEVK